MTPLKIIVTIVAVLVLGGFALHVKSLKDWLLFAVAEAEEYFGSGTGELKLRFVYDLAITQFPVVAKLIPFFVFRSFVDSALDVMRDLIEKNEKIAVLLTTSIPTTVEDTK